MYSGESKMYTSRVFLGSLRMKKQLYTGPPGCRGAILSDAAMGFRPA